MKWYKHFSKMRFDKKVSRLIKKYGIEGYGIYNAVLEMIAFELETDSPYPELEEESSDIAEFFKMDTMRVNEILSYCINEGLFEKNKKNGRISCLKLLVHLDNTMSANPEIVKIIKNFNEIKKDYINDSSTVTISENKKDDKQDLNKLEETLSLSKQITLDKTKSDKIKNNISSNLTNQEGHEKKEINQENKKGEENMNPAGWNKKPIAFNGAQWVKEKWDYYYKQNYPNNPLPGWSWGKDGTFAKRLFEEYGKEYLEGLIEFFMVNFDDIIKKINYTKSSLVICFWTIYTFREQIRKPYDEKRDIMSLGTIDQKAKIILEDDSKYREMKKKINKAKEGNVDSRKLEHELEEYRCNKITEIKKILESVPSEKQQEVQNG